MISTFSHRERPTLRALVACVAAWGLMTTAPARGGDSARDGDQPASTRRPTIGLALGGGAGRGLAHIGVLEWFEANRIPIDVIAGTSMGGLVAGAWASGMTPAEIRALMRDTDWDNMFLADSPYKFKTFRRKEDSRAFPAQWHLGLKNGLKFPTGLNPGQRVQWLLNRIALPYGTLESFDQLPTPFRCVATDLNKSEVVVLDRGSLAAAMRATMAIPGVFTPVAIGDRLLVDGGTLDNIPADVVRAMGADIVIAVDVSADYDGAAQKQSVSMFEVLGRTIDTMMYAGVRVSLKAADMIIDPDLRKLSATDWRRSDDLADRGRDGAAAQADALRKYALDEAAWNAFVAARKARTPEQHPPIHAIEVRGADEDDIHVITEAVEITPGEPLDLGVLELALAHLTGNDRYETVAYHVEKRDGRNVLVLDVVPKSYAPPYLHVAFDLQNLDSTNFAANLRMRLVAFDVLNAGSELRADASLGSNQMVGAELFVPLGNARLLTNRAASRMFIAPRAGFSRTQRNAFIDDQLVAEYRVKRTGAGVDLGFSSGRRSELRLGFDVADVRANLRVGPPLLPEARGTDRFASMRYTFDGWTSPLVPTRGLLAKASLKRYFSSARPTAEAFADTTFDDPNQFWQAETSLTQFFRVREADRVFVGASGGSSFGKAPVINGFRLGGPFRLSSKSLDEVTGPNYALATAGYLRRVGRLPDFLGSSILLGGWAETGTAFDDVGDADLHASISTGLVIETIFGPLYTGLSTGSGGGLKFYVALGPIFK